MTVPSFSGFGLGLRKPHYGDFLERQVPVDFVEVISENFMVDGGRPREILRRVRERYPVAMHGVSMSLGSADGLDRDYLRRLRQLADALDPLFISDHLSWSRFEGFSSHDLLPLPYTEEVLDLVCTNLAMAQDVLGRAMLVENPSSYLSFDGSTLSEWEFLDAMCARTGCGLLLDVNNIVVSAANHGFDALAYLAGIPASRVRQIHLAGHMQGQDLLIDTHDQPVPNAVWGLLEAVVDPGRAGRDDDRARRPYPAASRVAGRTRDRPRYRRQIATGSGMSLVALQREFRSLLTDQDATPVALGVHAPAPGLAVYRNNYRGQLMACLEQSFPCLLGWLGDDAFALAAAAHVVRVEPSDWSLDAYPASFAVTLADLYPDDPEVAELARLEADLDQAFVAGDATPLAAGALDDVDWDRATFILVPSLVVRDVSTNAPALWSALAASRTPPAVDRLAIPGGVIVWRNDFVSCFRATDAIELDALRFVLAKRSFGSLCQRLVETLGSDDGTARAGALLGQWLRDGLIIAIQPE